MDVTSVTALSAEAAPRRTTPAPFLRRDKTPLLVRATREATPFPASQPAASPSGGAPSLHLSARSPGQRRTHSCASFRRRGHRCVVGGDGCAVLLRSLVPPLSVDRPGEPRTTSRRLGPPRRGPTFRRTATRAERASLLRQIRGPHRKQQISKTVQNPLRPLGPGQPGKTGKASCRRSPGGRSAERRGSVSLLAWKASAVTGESRDGKTKRKGGVWTSDHGVRTKFAT